MNRIAEKARMAGFDTLILGVRDDHGFAPYESDHSPRVREADPEYPAGYDLVASGIRAAREEGLGILLAYPTFCEGHLGANQPRIGLAFRHPDWMVHVIGIRDGKTEIRPLDRPDPGFRSPTAIDQEALIWVSPSHPEVVAHELAVLGELMDRYPADGVVLDRARYLGVASDFSPGSRLRFEAHRGAKVERWPDDVATVVDGTPPTLRPGPLYGPWMQWRVETIHAFMSEVRALMDRTPGRKFANYAGSWYPIYDQLGVNWADPDTVPPYPHAGPGYQAAGFARLLDLAISGLYYPEVEESEALALGHKYWYSVRGAARMALDATRHVRPLLGGLYLMQYRENPAQCIRAIRACLADTDGVMVFDVSHIEDFDWWPVITTALRDAPPGEVTG